MTMSASITNQFADEEVASEFGYLSGYAPKGITDQTNPLRALFSGISYPTSRSQRRVAAERRGLVRHSKVADDGPDVWRDRAEGA